MVSPVPLSHTVCLCLLLAPCLQALPQGHRAGKAWVREWEPCTWRRHGAGRGLGLGRPTQGSLPRELGWGRGGGGGGPCILRRTFRRRGLTCPGAENTDTHPRPWPPQACPWASLFSVSSQRSAGGRAGGQAQGQLLTRQSLSGDKHTNTGPGTWPLVWNSWLREGGCGGDSWRGREGGVGRGGAQSYSTATGSEGADRGDRSPSALDVALGLVAGDFEERSSV